MIVSNLAIAFGTLAETVELFLAIFMMIGGIILTWLVQRWADKTGDEQPVARSSTRAGRCATSRSGRFHFDIVGRGLAGFAPPDLFSFTAGPGHEPDSIRPHRQHLFVV
jgi:hypothetical protein